MFRLEHQPYKYLLRFLEKKDFDKMERFAQSVKMNPLMYFVPNGAQERYINTIARSTEDTKIPVILSTFANGVGKTTMSVVVLLNIIFGPQNGWFDYPFFRKWKFPRLCWYCSTADAINDVIYPLIQYYAPGQFVPEFEHDASKEGRRIISKIYFPNQDFTVSCKTYEQRDQVFESANVGLVIDDEPSPETIWKAQKSRRRMGCVSLLPMTPLNCEPYILDEIKRFSDQGRKGYYHLKATVYEACKKRGVRGHLDAEIIDDMVEGYDEDERDARAYGEFMYFSRSVYGDLLSRDKHYISPDDYPIPMYSKIVHGVDPHDSRPSASLWGAKLPGQIRRYILFAESPIDQSRSFWEMKRSDEIETEIKMWSDIEERYYKPNVRILDRNFGWQTRGQRTLAELYLNEGRRQGKDFRFISSYTAKSDESELAFGHQQVRRLLRDQEDGKPGILIYKNCYHTWNGLIHYIRKKIKGVTADEKVAIDAPLVEKYKDFPDVVRYIICHDVIVKDRKRAKTEADLLREIALRPPKSKYTEFTR